MTRDTVIGDTPASAATSSMVTPRLLRRTDFLGFSNTHSFTRLVDAGLAIEAPGFIRHRNAHEKLDREPVIQMPGMLPLTPQAGDSRRTAFLARIICLFVLCGVGMACVPAARAEDGYDLWLRYRAVEAGRAQAHPPYVTQLVAGTTTPTMTATLSAHWATRSR